MKKAALFTLCAKASYDFIIGNKKERQEKKTIRKACSNLIYFRYVVLRY